MSQHASFYSYIGHQQPQHQQVEESYQAGFNLVALHSGHVISESINGQKIEITAPSIFIASSTERYSLLNQFKSGAPLKYTLLQLSSQCGLISNIFYCPPS